MSPASRLPPPASLYEVELKFRLEDAAGLVSRLEEMGATRAEPIGQRDTYFAHPARDFGRTDEALRIRTAGDENRITYKGPQVDLQSKTRHEIEIPFAAGCEAAAQLAGILRALGFREVRDVEKRRTPYHVDWEGRHLELAVDEVAGLGTFFEIETSASEGEREAARDSILRFAGRLGLANSVRKSYLCLLLEKEGIGSRE